MAGFFVWAKKPPGRGRGQARRLTSENFLQNFKSRGDYVVRIVLTQAFDEQGRCDFDTVLFNDEVEPANVPRLLYEFVNHPNNNDYGELVVSMPSPNQINVMLYNGPIE